jgi:hypothetical protein
MILLPSIPIGYLPGCMRRLDDAERRQRLSGATNTSPNTLHKNLVYELRERDLSATITSGKELSFRRDNYSNAAHDFVRKMAAN